MKGKRLEGRVRQLEGRVRQLEGRVRQLEGRIHRPQRDAGGAPIMDATPERQAEVLFILAECGVFACSAAADSDSEGTDSHHLCREARPLLQAQGVLDERGYLAPGVTAGALRA